MSNIRLKSVAGLLSMIIVGVAAGQGTKIQPPDPFNQKVQALELREQTLFDVLAYLNQGGLPISIETIPGSGQQSNPKFTVSVAAGTVADVLNQVCTLDRRYTWSRDGTMANVYPREEEASTTYLFNRRLRMVLLDAAKDPSQASIQAVHELPGLPAQLIVLQTGMRYEFPKAWTVSYSNLTIRQVLNRIAAHLCRGCAWQSSGTLDEPIVMFYEKLTPR